MSPESCIGFAHGEAVLVAGMPGRCWRIHQGAVRLTRWVDDSEHFAGLARTGDLIGVEALMGHDSTFSAYALSELILEPSGALDSAALLAALASSEQRAAEALALCRGTADERIARLMTLLAKPTASGHARVQMPSLREMAEITNLTQETISRVVSRLRRLGQLVRNSRAQAEFIPCRGLATGNPGLSLAA